MGFLLSLLTNRYVIIGIVVTAVVGGGFFYVTGLQKQVIKLKADNQVLKTNLQISEDSVKTLKISINDQNTAIDKFKTDADVRVKAGQAAVAAAKASSDNYKAQAAAILSAKLPKDANACNAANELINSEIKNAK